jgi:uncharacterized damage-inducible protein DinB
MKEALLQFARYNIWANKLMIDALLKLNATQLDMEITSSFNTIRKTVLHSYAAEYIWLQRLQLAENPVWAGNDTDMAIADVCADWLKVSEALAAFVEKQFDDRALEHVVQYYNMQKQLFKTPVYQVLQHTFNHATYHRGQLITMLRQAGVTKIPSTDYIKMIWKN